MKIISSSLYLENIFDKYKLSNPEEMTLDMDDISSLLEDLNIDPFSVQALYFLYNLTLKPKAGEKNVLRSYKVSGQISKLEFVEGLGQYNIQSFRQLREYAKLLAVLPPPQTTSFANFYKFCFKFSLEGTFKALDFEIVQELLPLLLPPEDHPHVSPFLHYLGTLNEKAKKTKIGVLRVNADCWNRFLVFCNTIEYDCSNFDLDDGSWPVVIDEYCEWRIENIEGGCDNYGYVKPLPIDEAVKQLEINDKDEAPPPPQKDIDKQNEANEAGKPPPPPSSDIDEEMKDNTTTNVI